MAEQQSIDQNAPTFKVRKFTSIALKYFTVSGLSSVQVLFIFLPGNVWFEKGWLSAFEI